MADKQIHVNHDYQSTARPKNVPDPVDALDGANKQYVDAKLEGLAWKANVRVKTAGNINLAAPGASIDGVAMVVNDRFAASDQTDLAENGLYIWNGAAVPATRSADASTSMELENAVVSIEEGTSSGTTWRQQSVNFELGVNDIVFSPFGTVSPPASESVKGLIEIATQAEVNAGLDDGLAITPQKLANWAGRPLRYSTLIGDGAEVNYVVTHNLNSRDVVVQVRRNSGAYDEIDVAVERTGVNSVTVKFLAAPSADQYRVTVLA